MVDKAKTIYTVVGLYARYSRFFTSKLIHRQRRSPFPCVLNGRLPVPFATYNLRTKASPLSAHWWWALCTFWGAEYAENCTFFVDSLHILGYNMCRGVL